MTTQLSTIAGLVHAFETVTEQDQDAQRLAEFHVKRMTCLEYWRKRLEKTDNQTKERIQTK